MSMYNKIRKKQEEEIKNKIVRATNAVNDELTNQKLNWYESMDVISNVVNSFMVSLGSFIRSQDKLVKDQAAEIEKLTQELQKYANKPEKNIRPEA